jgi:hypothetical protein
LRGFPQISRLAFWEIGELDKDVIPGYREDGFRKCSRMCIRGKQWLRFRGLKSDSINMTKSCERNITEIKSTDSGKPFTVSTNLIRKRLLSIGRNKSVGPDGIPGDILRLGGEVIVPYLTRLLNITMNNNAIAYDWKKAIVVPIYK